MNSRSSLNEQRARSLLEELKEIPRTLEGELDVTPYLNRCEYFFKSAYEDPDYYLQFREFSSRSPNEALLACGSNIKQWLARPQKSRSPFKRLIAKSQQQMKKLGTPSFSLPRSPLKRPSLSRSPLKRPSLSRSPFKRPHMRFSSPVKRSPFRRRKDVYEFI